MDPENFKGSEIILEVNLDGYVLYLSKLIECTTQKVNTNVNGFLVNNKYQYCFTDCKKMHQVKM